MQSGIFLLKEFETWDAMPNKTYPSLKTFIHEAYTRRLTAISLRNTAGSLGYIGNNANAFAGMNSTTGEGEETDDDDATTSQREKLQASRRLEKQERILKEKTAREEKRAREERRREQEN